MTQNIPKALDVLLTFVAQLLRGLELFEAVVGVKYNTKAVMEADLAAARTAKEAGEAAQTARTKATAARNAVDQNVIAFLGVARELFKARLGRRYTISWKQAGFTNSLAVSRTMNGRVSQVSSIKLYLEANPELEVPGVLTAAIAGNLYTTAVAAMNDVDIALAVQREKTIERNAAAARLLKRARALCHELKLLLPANDPRWLEFGYNVPGDVSVPGAPEKVVATSESPGKVAVSWEPAVHTDHCRVFCKVVGQDAEFAAKASIRESTITLTGLPSGGHLQLYLTAVNRAGESVPSEIVEILVL